MCVVFVLQMCETKAALPYYAPCTSYKLNVEWTQHTDDRQVSAICVFGWVLSTHAPSPL